MPEDVESEADAEEAMEDPLTYLNGTGTIVIGKRLPSLINGLLPPFRKYANPQPT